MVDSSRLCKVSEFVSYKLIFERPENSSFERYTSINFDILLKPRLWILTKTEAGIATDRKFLDHPEEVPTDCFIE